jgi:hypothetical protein
MPDPMHLSMLPTLPPGAGDGEAPDGRGTDSRVPDGSAADEAGAACLLIEAGGRRLACAYSVVLEVGRIDSITPVPGGADWLAGLVQWRGRLLTLIDAGRLFGLRPTQGRWIVVLRGLRVETALVVDALLGTDDPGGTAALVLDSEALAAHPALQPGAAAGAPAPGEPA